MLDVDVGSRLRAVAVPVEPRLSRLVVAGIPSPELLVMPAPPLDRLSPVPDGVVSEKEIVPPLVEPRGSTKVTLGARVVVTVGAWLFNPPWEDCPESTVEPCKPASLLPLQILGLNPFSPDVCGTL